MRPRAHWTVKVAAAAVSFAAAAGGLSSVALASPGASTGYRTSGPITVFGSGLLGSIPSDVCGDVSGLLGIAAAGCGGGVTASAGTGHEAPARVDKPAHGTQAGGSGANGSGHRGSLAGVNTAGGSTAGRHATGHGAVGTATPGAAPAPGLAALRPIFGDTLDAPGLGANPPGSPDVSASAGLGTLPGLADLPSQHGLANPPGPRGATGGSTLLPGSTLSAAASGMSSGSFAVLAIGALLAGAAALKIASRRARDRKAGIGAAI